MEWFGEVIFKAIGFFVFGLFFTAVSSTNTGIEVKDFRFKYGFILCILIAVVVTAYSKQQFAYISYAENDMLRKYHFKHSLIVYYALCQQSKMFCYGIGTRMLDRSRNTCYDIA